MLKALDDLTTQSSLDAIGLNSNEGTLHVYCWKAADTNEEEEEEACQNSDNKHVIRSVFSFRLSYKCVSWVIDSVDEHDDRSSFSSSEELNS